MNPFKKIANIYDLIKHIPNPILLSKKLYEYTIEEVKIISEKIQDLGKTNYELGIFHLNNGNISDAIFRFKILKKFQANRFDDIDYYLAFCYFLKKDFKNVLKYLTHFELKSKTIKFQDEILYIKSLIEKNFDKIQKIPNSIVKIRFNSIAQECKRHLMNKKLLKQLYYDETALLLKNFYNSVENPIFQNALDVACGTGFFAKKLLEYDIKFKNLVGVDLSDKMLLSAQETHLYSRLENEDFEKFIDQQISTNQKYDLILFLNALGSIRDFEKIAKKIKSISKETTILLLFIPNNFQTEFFNESSEQFLHDPQNIVTLLEKYSFVLDREQSLKIKKGSNGKIMIFIPKVL